VDVRRGSARALQNAEQQMDGGRARGRGIAQHREGEVLVGGRCGVGDGEGIVVDERTVAVAPLDVDDRGDFLAVDNLSFVIRKGEITGLLGPNGAGKTTTLRMLTCFLKPSEGSITVGEHRVDRDPIEVKKMIGYLPESAPLYGDMLVYDYLNYVARIRGVADGGRLKEIAGLCGVNEVMHKNVNELSKGYRQRVGLAQAMIHDPEILILDEPTSGLDPNQIVEIRTLIKEIGRKKTVILSTHILSEVEATCERVIIINRGRLIADAVTSELTTSSGRGARLLVKIGGASFDELSAALGGLAGVESVQEKHDPAGLAAAEIASPGQDMRAAVFNLVKERGWVLYEMTPLVETLEHVFRELTRGGDNEF